MIDVVFVLGTGSVWGNNEIRYSLRSIEKHLKNYRGLYIIGERPSFLKDIVHIQHPDETRWKETNIFKKVVRASIEPVISHDFMFFNDDHFLVSDFDALSFPYFHKRDLSEMIARRPYAVGGYVRVLKNCRNVLAYRKLPTLNFDHHSPIKYNKSKILQLLTSYDWSIRGGYAFKSLYANTFKVEGEYDPDCKIIHPLDYQSLRNIIDKRRVFSIGNKAINDSLKKVMQELYPTPSKWEADF